MPLDGREKGLLHHFFTPEELQELFRGFNITDTHLDRGGHYCLTAVKGTTAADFTSLHTAFFSISPFVINLLRRATKIYDFVIVFTLNYSHSRVYPGLQ